MAVGKAVVSVVSIVLVVGAVIGLIAVVGRSKSESKDGDAVWTSAKAITHMCSTTPYTATCTTSLSAKAVCKNETANPKDYLRAVVEATVEELNKGLQVALSIKKSIEESKTTWSMDEENIKSCEAQLKYALEDIDELILKTLDETSPEDFGQNAYDLRVWLTTIDVYQDNCLDNIRNPEQREAMESGLHNSTELTRIAVDIVYGFGEILKAFNIPINLNGLQANPTPSSSRRLLEQIEIDQDGYPTWLHHTDRKLLEGRAVPQPHVVVAKDGTGLKKISEALEKYPMHHKGRFIIYIKAGVYDDKNITVQRYMKNVFMYGDGIGKTIITANISQITHPQSGAEAAVFTVYAIGFMARSMTFSNAAGSEGEQAVALRIVGDHSAVFDCSLEAHQDTLYYNSNRQFYKNCHIYGTIDFIFGKGMCLIQDSEIVVRKPGQGQNNVVTADGRLYPNETTILVIQNCRITADGYLGPLTKNISTYLGRPWKPYARTVIMETEIGNLTRPEGYQEWNKTSEHWKTATYLEYANRGPGADTALRVKWPNVRVIDRSEAQQFTAGQILDSNYSKYKAHWLEQNSRYIPFNFGLSS